MLTYQLENFCPVCQARDIEGGLAGGLICLCLLYTSRPAPRSDTHPPAYIGLRHDGVIGHTDTL